MAVLSRYQTGQEAAGIIFVTLFPPNTFQCFSANTFPLMAIKFYRLFPTISCGHLHVKGLQQMKSMSPLFHGVKTTITAILKGEHI